MSFSCALVGLPNVGKSTIFNIILKKSIAASANYPFCTIEPNKGSVPIEDERLYKLSELSNTKKIIPAIIDCVDVAGLVKGASKGEGLGNEFLGHIRECDLIIHVLRCFENSDIIHVENSVDPLRDYEDICLELQLADLNKFENILINKKKSAKDKQMAEEAKKIILNNELLSKHQWEQDYISFFNLEGILTHKPMIVVANMQIASDEALYEKVKHLNPVKIFAEDEILLQGASEEEVMELKDMINIDKSNIDQLVKFAYEKLNLITFFTTGEKETRAWRIQKGYTMQQCAGCIHTDFFSSFISAQVVNYEDFVQYKTWANVQQAGKIQLCSKEYIAQDGQICIFKTFK